MTYSLFSIDRANSIIERVAYIHRVFGGFITGKLIDSLIIGVLCFIGMRVMMSVGLLTIESSFALLISVIIGVTNIIPFFGPFIGAIPSAILIMVTSPLQALYFVIFIIILQQIDGNILGPKILGNSTGLSSFWVMFAILIFGGLFGFVGWRSAYRCSRSFTASFPSASTICCITAVCPRTRTTTAATSGLMRERGSLYMCRAMFRR